MPCIVREFFLLLLTVYNGILTMNIYIVVHKYRLRQTAAGYNLFIYIQYTMNNNNMQLAVLTAQQGTYTHTIYSYYAVII